MVKLSKSQFIATLAPMAIRARQDGSPLFPSVRLAQNLLETGGVIHSWNNLGGIKVGNGKPNAFWHGKWVRKGTWEVEDGTRVDTWAMFRAYDSVYDFYRDQDLLFQISRYERVRKAKTPSQQAEALRLCGYATDPQYSSKINSIIQSYSLTQYDEQAKAKPMQSENKIIPITVNGVQVAEGQLIDNQTWVPARIVGEAIQIKVGWNGKAATANGIPLTTQVIGTTGYVPVRELVSANASVKLTWNQDASKVEITID
ncbi:glucosaminidase domain-containing protein [Cohnella sp. WQ 127256]|uniref:glucosaminidase domain-containing protein n=1 Tax=Cohnella sp. WQ 127256 TaxID=2938790 RepID=UPI002118EA2A|nr:glucosaminidase domain-containing protein [Cohnella sp. WQ 127256]